MSISWAKIRVVLVLLASVLIQHWLSTLPVEATQKSTR